MINLNLWAHQRRMVDFAEGLFDDRGYAWILAQPRTGKTLAMLALAEKMKAERMLVVTTKAAVRGAWGSDVDNHTSGLDFIPLDTGSVESRGRWMQETMAHAKPIVFGINYESARSLTRQIKDGRFDLVVLDESHKIKSHNSGVSLNLAEACAEIPYKICMTGTAWDDRPTDAYGQVRFFDPILRRRPAYHASNILGYWGDFYERYVNYYQLSRGVKIVTGYKRKDELLAIVDPFTLRIAAEDVLDLPPVQHIYNHIPMTREMSAAYGGLQRDNIYGNLTVDNALTMGLRLHQLTGGYLASNSGDGTYLKSSPKVETTLDLLDELADYPVVIVTRFETDVRQIADQLIKTGRDFYTLTGQHDNHMEWRRKTGNEVLIVNIAAGAEGVDLSRARYVILYSIGYSATQYAQVLARCRSNNSDKAHPITYHHLLVDHSIDGVIDEAIRNKREMSTSMYEALSK